MSFTGGKLKVKGGDPLGVKGNIKKKKKKTKQDANDHEAEPLASLEGTVIVQTEDVDKRTEAEKRYDEYLRKRDKERALKLANKSHRERIKDFNDKLASLTEHHDIPKVGPG